MPFTNLEIIQRAIRAGLGHVKPDYRSRKQLDDTARILAEFVIGGLNHECREQELPRFRGWSSPMTRAERRYWERYAVGRFLGAYFRMKPQSPNA